VAGVGAAAAADDGQPWQQGAEPGVPGGEQPGAAVIEFGGLVEFGVAFG
jgi:hypothetical protein